MKKELKKYAAIIGEKTPENTKVLNEVFDELEKAGFGKARRNCHYSIVEFYKGYIGHLSVFDGRMKTHEFLWPSDVLARAHELEGARKHEDTPPDGMRIVTDQERKDNVAPIIGADGYSFAKIGRERWHRSYGTPTAWDDSDYIYAVPADYVFPKPWEIAPEGGKFIDDEILYSGRFFAKYWYINEGCTYWSKSSGVPYRHSGKRYAVPNDFTFEPEVVEMTMAEVCKLAGKKVKIVK